MALARAKVRVPLGHGIAEQFAPGMTPLGKLSAAEQAVIAKDGSIQVRWGFRDLPTDVFFDPTLGGVSVSDVARLVSHESETCVSTGTQWFTYSEQDEQWIYKDHTYEATVEKRIRGERGRDAINVAGDVCYCNGYYCTAWYDAVRECMCVRFHDASTGARFPEVTFNTSRYLVRVVAAGDLVHVIHYHAGVIEARTFDTTDLESALSAPGQTTIGPDAHTPGIFDACSAAAGAVERVYLAYNYLGDPTSIRVRRFDYDLSNAVTTDVSAESQRVIAIAAQVGQVVWVAYTADSADTPDGLCYFTLTESSHALLYTPTCIDSAIYQNGVATRAVGIAALASEAIVVYEQGSACSGAFDDDVPELRARWVNSTGSLGDGNRTYRVGMLSKPIIYGAEPYVVGYYQGPQCVEIADIEADDAVGLIAERFGYLLHIPTVPVTLPEE